jgi:hypothetical protein
MSPARARESVKRAVRKPPPTGITTPRPGVFFHTFKDGRLCRQGHIVRAVGDQRWRVEFFDFAFGDPCGEETIPACDMTDWVFYSSGAES